MKVDCMSAGGSEMETSWAVLRSNNVHLALEYSLSTTSEVKFSSISEKSTGVWYAHYIFSEGVL